MALSMEQTPDKQWNITKDYLKGRTLTHDGPELPVRFKLLDGNNKLFFDGRMALDFFEGPEKTEPIQVMQAGGVPVSRMLAALPGTNDWGWA